MRFSDFRAGCAMALVAAAMAGTAAADVTPAEVWADMQDMAARTGASLSVADEQASGDTLRLSGVTSTLSIGPNSSTTQINEIRLVDQGDGKVRIEMSPELRTQTRTSPDDSVVMENTGTVTFEGLDMMASGSPGNIEYDVSAERVSSASQLDGTEELPMSQSTRLMLTDVSGNLTSVLDGETLRVTAKGNAARYQMEVATTSPEPDGNMTMTANGMQMTFTSDGAMPPVEGEVDFMSILENATGISGGYALGQSEIALRLGGAQKGMIVNLGSDSSRFDVALADGALDYSIGIDRSSFAVQGSAMPPVSGTIAASEIALNLPLVPSEDARDFGLRVALDDLALDENLWAMFDPAGTLPRDPADLVLDASGLGMWTMDLMDPEAIASAEASGEAPGSIESASLNELSLSFLGAMVRAQGAFTFPEGGGSMPVPAGTVDVEAAGLQALIQKLQMTGLIPPQFGAGALLMLGTYAQPGEAPDTFTSQVVFTEDGHITANGQPLK